MGCNCYLKYIIPSGLNNELILVKEEGGTGFPRAGRAALMNFLRAKPQGNPEEGLLSTRPTPSNSRCKDFLPF